MIPLLLARWNHFWAALALDGAIQIFDDAAEEKERAEQMLLHKRTLLAESEVALVRAREIRRKRADVRRLNAI